MMGDILAPAGEFVAVAAQEVASVTQCGRLMCEVVVLIHIRRFNSGDAAKLGIKRQGGQAVIGPILI